MTSKPKQLYHGSPSKIEGQLKPVFKQDLPDHTHGRPAVFGTERIDIASLFMFPPDTLASIGFEQDIAYICIWGTAEEFAPKDMGGYLYTLPGDLFEKVGKEYEWQSFIAVKPIEIKSYDSVIDGMIQNGVQVYFVSDNEIFDQIVVNKDHRSPILKNLTSLNQILGVNIKKFE